MTRVRFTSGPLTNGGDQGAAQPFLEHLRCTQRSYIRHMSLLRPQGMVSRKQYSKQYSKAMLFGRTGRLQNSSAHTSLHSFLRRM